MFGRKKEVKKSEWKEGKDVPIAAAVPKVVAEEAIDEEIEEEMPEVPEAKPIVPVETKPKPDQGKTTITNPTIDTFTILVRYHEEMVKALSKYDGIIAELLKLTQQSDEDEENSPSEN